MKAKNRVGTFDLGVRKYDLIGTRIWIYLSRWTTIDDFMLVTDETASFNELKAQVELLKADLDAILEKAAQHFE